MRYVVYDIEIKKAVPGIEDPVDGVDYCAGWDDHANMGVACVGAFESWSGRYRVFFDDNKADFGAMMSAADLAVGFNNVRFDDKVLAACGWPIEPKIPRYDILRELWAAKGMDPDRFDESHKGHSLAACAQANFGADKTGYGGTAPIDFQRGRWGSLVDYCLNDVRLTDRLFQRILRDSYILDPVQHDMAGAGRSAVLMPDPRWAQFGARKAVAQ